MMDLLVAVQRRHRVFATCLAGSGAAIFRALVQHVMDLPHATEMTGHQAVRLTWALGKVGFKDFRTYQVLTTHMVQRCTLASLQPPELSMSLYGLAKGQARVDPFIDAVADRAMSPGAMDAFDSQTVANMVWALATLKAHRPILMATFSRRVQVAGFLASFSAQALANTAWGYATLDHRDEALLQAIAEAVLRPTVLEAFNPQNVANLAWAYARLKTRNEPLMAALAGRALQPGLGSDVLLASFEPQNGANLAWAFATLELKHLPLMDGLAHWATRTGMLPRFSAQSVANLVWAYATSKVLNDRLMEAVAETVVHRSFLATGQPQHFSMVLWAFATLGVHHEAMLAAIMHRLLQGNFLNDFGAQELSNTAWALGVFRVCDPRLLHRIAQCALQLHQRAALTAQHVVTLAWMLATLGHRHDALLAACERWAAIRLEDPHCIAREAVTVAWASATLGLDHVPLIEQVGQWATEDVQRLQNVQDIANLAWSLAVAASLRDDVLAPLLARFETMLQAVPGGAPPEVFRQLHSLMVHVEQHPALLPRSYQFLAQQDALRATCATHFAAAAAMARRSNFQRTVVTALQHLGLQCEEEVTLTEAGGYSVDLFLRNHNIAVEVDGPSHFVTTVHGLQPSGSTALKHRQLRAFGIEVVSIPFHVFNPMEPAQRVEYLRQMVLNLCQSPVPRQPPGRP